VTVLADTSVWVDYLRRGPSGAAADLDRLLHAGEIVLCGPVVAELLAGAGPAHRGDLWQLFSSLPWAEFGRAQWRRVGEAAAALRERGESVALTDVEIAVAATDAGAALWSRDADFVRIAGVLDDLDRFVPAGGN